MTAPSSHNADPVRLALVGLGGHGRTLQQAAERVAGLDVAAVYDPVADEAERAAARFGCEAATSYEALLARGDLDAIVLCTPNHLHRAQAESALEVGLDVFVEKPIANTVADGLAMIRQATDVGRVLMVGHNMRYGEAVRRARACLEGGRLGELVSVELHFSSDTALRLDPSSWRLRPDQCPLLPMMQLGIHALDLVHYLVGRIGEVYAQARAVRVTSGAVDNVVASFSVEGGTSGTIVSNYCSPVRFTYHVAGTEGTLKGTPLMLDVHLREGRTSERFDASDAPFASYVEQFETFATSVRARTSPETDGWCGVQALAVVEAMAASIERHAPALVPDLYAEASETHTATEA